MNGAKLWREYVNMEQENIRLKDRLAEAERDASERSAVCAGMSALPRFVQETCDFCGGVEADQTRAYVTRLQQELADAVELLREVAHDGQDIGGNIELFDRIDAFLNPTPPAPRP